MLYMDGRLNKNAYHIPRTIDNALTINTLRQKKRGNCGIVIINVIYNSLKINQKMW